MNKERKQGYNMICSQEKKVKTKKVKIIVK